MINKRCLANGSIFVIGLFLTASVQVNTVAGAPRSDVDAEQGAVPPVEVGLPHKDWPGSPFGGSQPRETWKAPEPADLDLERGFLLFRRHYLDVLHPRSKPRPEEVGTAVAVSASRGETEPFTVAVWALEDLVGVWASISPFTSGEGATIPPSAVVVKVVDNYTKRWVDTDTKRHVFRRIPLVLRDNRTLAMAAGECARFWFELRVPDNATPGLYEAQVTVWYRGRKASLPVSLKVHPFSLREAPQFRAMFFNMMPDSGFDYGSLERVFRNMKDHGMNSVIFSQVQLHPGTIDPATNTAMYDFDLPCPQHQPYSYRRFMQTLVRSGLCARSGRVGGNFLADRRYVLDEQLKKELERKIPGSYLRDQSRCIRLVIAEHRRNGWPEPLFYLADEPKLKGLSGLANTGDFFRERGARTFVPFLATDRHEMEGPYIDAIGPHLDIWCVYPSQLTARAVQRARELKKELWSFNGGSYGWVPIAARRFFGRFALRWGLDGICQWAIYPGRTPGRDAWYLLQDREGMLPAMAWEAVREGVDDLRYDATAAHWIKAAREAGFANEADAADEVRTAFFATMPEDHYWNWRDDFSRTDYDLHRHRTASAITGLVKLLEEK